MADFSNATADIGLIGLAVMGQNLVLNMADHGFKVAVFNRTVETMEKFVVENPDTPGGLVPCRSEEELVKAIKTPRKIVILVKAGKPVDMVIDGLLPHLDKGDIIIDGGNSLWTDTIRRERELAARGFNFVGSGVSGGEEGARFGPSLMPGGSPDAWKSLKPVWEAIAAKVDKKTGNPIEGAAPGRPVKGGVPCTAHIGPDGAGHYVKMIHNGIEYGDMQMICEAYFLLKNLLGLKPDELSKIFTEWNEGDLASFLIEITADILQQRDPMKPKRFLVDAVLDTAGQKGTGKWTSTNALDMGVPAATIAEAVFARCLSAVKDQRVAASRKLKGPAGKSKHKGKKSALIEAVRDALYCSKICSYAQGFQLMAEAQKEYKWKLNFGEIAMIWRGGCIIRARFLQKIKEAYDRDPELINLLLDPYFKKKVEKAQANWRKVVALAAEAGVACPAFMSALSYFDGYRSAVLPANLLQAQRDYFGAHTYERVDQPRGTFFHIDWPDPKRPQITIAK
ncbi:MAG: NADP-dependent phosphogluconate dehydrogenase [Phycisphaeraceae bacterium]|nr:NADP-dependent phosphogluconate dehydrogenase [Phycisphaeraceae bacterium]